MQTLYWRRLDADGYERLTLRQGPAGIVAHGTVITSADGGVALEHNWRLTPDWRALSVTLRHIGGDNDPLTLDRTAAGWSVNGTRRPDLDGADEPDLSLTPFCNTLAIRRLPLTPGATLTLDTAWIDGAALTVTRSRQRYDRLDAKTVHYTDLGTSVGFEADITTDAEGLVEIYEHLFERRD